MPKFQQTFTLIDPTVKMQNLIQRRHDETVPELAPMMTSKQAQKLWREKNKQPRVSREEQRRQEREEQARIKAEFEKEKASKRARFLRDKKKEKEQKLLEEKRKNGLPLVNVHPSQATISWFVRQRASTKRKLEETNDPDEDHHAPRPHPTQGERRQEPCAGVEPVPSSRPSKAPIAAGADKIMSPVATTTMAHPAPSQPQPLRDVSNYATPTPPTGTHFVIDHLEDFLPTPSQMDREFQEEYGTSSALEPLAKRPSPAHAVSRPPVPWFGDAVRVNANQFAPQIQTSVAPFPAQVLTNKLVDRIKNAIDYFSQDWELSSQDIRNLEGTTTTPSKVAKRPPPIVNVQSPVAKSIPGLTGDDPTMDLNCPPPSNQESRLCSPEDIRPFRKPSQSASQSKVPGSRQRQSARQSSMALRPSPQKTQQSSPRPEPCLPKLRLSPAAPDPAPSKQATPPQPSGPPRFFGSSGNGVELLMGLWESHKLAEKEKRKQKEAEKKRLAEEAKQQVEEKKVEEIAADDLLLSLSQCSIRIDDIEEPQDAGLAHLQSQAATEVAILASQAETDYGDDDFGELEQDTLNLLDAVATAVPITTTTAGPMVTVTTCPVHRTAGGAMCEDDRTTYDLGLGFDLGDDDSWLADDDDLDF